MSITSGHLYFVSDEFFKAVNDPNLKRNYTNTKRPHYFAFKDPKTSLLWLVPCTSKIEKFEKILEKKKEHGKPTDTIKIVKIQNKKSVLLFQDMFPIKENYIENQYIRGGQPVKIADPKVIESLEKTAKKVIALLHRDIKFTPTQPDVNKIEKIMLTELNKSRENISLKSSHSEKKIISMSERMSKAKLEATKRNNSISHLTSIKPGHER